VRVLRTSGLVAALLAVWLPLRVQADDMDPALSRLVQLAENAPCAATPAATVCPDHEAFEHLVSELSVALAPPIATGAASTGARGFYVGVSSTATPIRARERYWAKGTRGASPSDEQNRHVDSMLAWNRIDVRKGLPFGLEVGSSLGYGVDTSLWVLSAELRVVVFEGFHSGLGALPDVALRVVTQSMFGSSELSVRTHTLDVTLSKPFVLGGVHRVTPLLALQALFASAKSGRIDLTPGTNAWSACSPTPAQTNGVELNCEQSAGSAELANNSTFRSVNQTRVRLFLGAEERYSWLSVTATLGFDLAVPQLQTDMEGVGPDHVMRQISFHLACGLRY
jgi:hypothetical protein